MSKSKIDWSAIGGSIKTHWKILAIVGAIVVAFGVWFFAADQISDYLADRRAKKVRESVEQKELEKKDLQVQITELEKKKAQLDGEIIAETEELNKDLEVLPDLKKQADEALANHKKAVETKSDTDRTAQDLIDALKRLEEAQP